MLARLFIIAFFMGVGLYSYYHQDSTISYINVRYKALLAVGLQSKFPFLPRTLMSPTQNWTGLLFPVWMGLTGFMALLGSETLYFILALPFLLAGSALTIPFLLTESGFSLILNLLILLLFLTIFVASFCLCGNSDSDDIDSDLASHAARSNSFNRFCSCFNPTTLFRAGGKSSRSSRAADARRNSRIKNYYSQSD